jgi:L-fucose isomerase-like protein
MASIIAQVGVIKQNSDRYRAKAELLKSYSDWSGVPDESFVNLCKLGVVFDEIVERDDLNCVAVRCWLELQQQLHVSPCVLMSELNERGVPFACEVDIGSAVAMQAVALATGAAPACLDWNNNYGDDPQKCILFHCGPVPQSMMQKKGRIEDHQILATAVGRGCSFGCNVGRIKPSAITFGNLSTEDGRSRMYIGEGEFTADSVPEEFFGTAGVARIENLQDVLLMIGNEGFRHHVAVANGSAREPLAEALQKYLGYEVIRV